MILRRLTIIITFLTAWVWSNGQQINAVPDYVFRNQMSVGRNAVTDTAAYFSIGPRYGANKGFMPPIVGDTATFSSGKRNGLLIFSVQKNKFLYWDSVRVQWSDMAGSSGSYIVAGDTASMLTPYVRHAGYGLTKSGQSFLVDTLNIATRAWRQKGVDSVAGLSRIGGSGTAFYIPRFATSSTLQNSIIYDDGAKVGVGTSSPIGTFQVYKSGAPAYITLTGGSGANQGAAFVIYKSNNSLSLINIGDKAALVGGAPDTAVTFRAGANVPLIFEPNASEALRLNNNQTITATSLAGSGSRIVVADANGTLSASSALSGYVDGSGTTNYIPKFTAGTTIGNSQIFDNGTNVGIGTTAPNTKTEIFGGDARVALSAVTTSTFRGYQMATGTTEFASLKAEAALGELRLTSGFAGFGGFTTMYTNGFERLRITSGGDVGIGTTSPSTLVHVQKNQNAVTTLRVENTDTTSSGARANISVKNVDVDYHITSIGKTGAGINAAFSGTNSNHTLYLMTNGTARQTIFANGRIGINTTTDAGYQLDVNGSFRASGLIRSQATVGNTNGYFQLDHPGAQTWKLGVFTDNTSTFSIGNDNTGTFASRYLNITNVGDIGIGTTSPSYKLDINGTLRSVNGANFATTSGNVGIGTASPGYKFDILNASATDANIFRSGMSGVSNGFTINRVASNFVYSMIDGNVGIGTASPVGDGTALNIYGSSFATIKLQNSTSGATATDGTDILVASSDLLIKNRESGSIITYTANTERGRINAAGEWILNADGTDAGDYKLQVSGNIYNTGSAVLAATSGNVGIGTASNQGKVDILADNATALGWGNLNLYTSTAQAADIGGSIAFGGLYNATQTTHWASIGGRKENSTSGNYGGYLAFSTRTNGDGVNTERMRISSSGELLIATTSDAGDYKLQVSGNIYNTGSITTGAPSGGTARPWKLGSVVATSVILDTANYVEVEINGVAYKLALVTPN